MKKLVLILSVVFVTMSSFSFDDTTNWCFDDWTNAYNGAIAAGFSHNTAVFIAGEVFNDCVENQQ